MSSHHRWIMAITEHVTISHGVSPGTWIRKPLSILIIWSLRANLLKRRLGCGSRTSLCSYGDILGIPFYYVKIKYMFFPRMGSRDVDEKLNFNHVEKGTSWSVTIGRFRGLICLEDSEPQIQDTKQWPSLHQSSSRKTCLGELLPQEALPEPQEMSGRDLDKNVTVLRRPAKRTPSKAEGPRSQKVLSVVAVWNWRKHVNNYRTA